MLRDSRDQRLARVRPRIGVGLVRIVVVDVGQDLPRQVCLGQEVATPDHPPRHHAEPYLHLVQPTPVLGREVDDVPVRRVRQERPPLRPPLELLRLELDPVQPREQPAHLQAPVRVEVIHHPMHPLHVRVAAAQPQHRVAEVRPEVLVGPAGRHVAVDLPRRGHEGGQQAARAMTDVLRFAQLGQPGLRRLARVLAFQGLDTGLLVGADDQLPLAVEHRGLEVQPAEVQRQRLELRVVGVHPRADLVRLEFGRGQDALDGAAAHVPVVGLVEDAARQVVQGPVRDRGAGVGGLGGSQHEDLVAVFRGKKRPGGRCVAGRAGRPSVAGGSAAASGRRWRGHRRVRRPPGRWWAGGDGRSGG